MIRYPLHRLFFYLTILLLPTQLGYHFWPDWALVLGRQVDYLAPTVFLTDITVCLTVFSYLLNNILNLKYKISNLHFKFKILTQLLIICSVVIINIIASVNPWVSVYKWLKICEFVLFGFYIVKTKPKLNRIVILLSVGVLYSSVIAIAQFVLQHSIGGIFWWLGERTFDINTPGIARYNLCLPVWGCREVLRPYATFPHPNVLAGFLVITISYIVLRIMYNGKRKTIKNNSSALIRTSPSIPLGTGELTITNLLLVPSIILGLTALILSFSRSAWIVGLVSGILFQISRIKHKSFLPLIISTIPPLITAVFIVISFSFKDESVVIRNELNKAAISIWRCSPITGVGLGNFIVKLPDFPVERGVYFLQPVHNMYLLILAETGITGLLLIIYLLLSYKVYRITYYGKKNKIRLLLMIPLAGLLLIGLADHYPLTLQQGQLMLTLVLALPLTYGND